MGLFSKIAEGVPHQLGIALTGIAAMWGIRTPPDPEVVAHMQPARGPEGSPGGPGRRPDLANQLVLPDSRRYRQEDEADAED